MKKMEFPYRHTRSLMLEVLATKQQGQFMDLVNGVVTLAIQRGLYATPRSASAGYVSTGPSPIEQVHPTDQGRVRELVRQLMWDFLVEKILVHGMNEQNPGWPWYRITGYGEQVVSGQGPQPYDPDGFMQEFQKRVPAADPVVLSYLAESVRSFTHDCPTGAAVLLGAASEKVILLLHEVFESSISDPAKKKQFQKAYNWTILSKFNALKDRLDRMIASKTLVGTLKETVLSEMPGIFQLIRRHRNAAGHPELLAAVEPGTVLLNLRVFSEYASRLHDLTEHFRHNSADW